VQLSYLGPLEVRDEGRLVALPGARLQQLLLQLALEPGRWVSAGALAEAVWGAEVPGDPANSLQSLVSRLRRALGRPELVEQSAAGYRLTLAPDDVDAVRFTRLVAEGRRLLAGGETAAARAVLDEAAALWRGAPLAGDDSPEASGRRAALTDLRLEVLRDLAGLAVAEGRAAEVLPLLEEATTAHPLREDLAGVLVDALAAVGRPAEALAVYERVRATLAETLGTDPSPPLRARHLELLRLADRPPAPPSNLRAALTSFIGRDDDVRGVRGRLSTARLVTVVGAGGSGKTRLVGEVAAAVLDDAVRPGALPAVPDGVWVIELAPVTDPQGIAQAVLDSLGLREVAIPDQKPDRPRLEGQARLLDALADAGCLLVVDNCEHLVDAVAGLVAELLGRCPGVRVLATSREPLGIDGEVLHPLGPLPVPPEGTPAEAAADNPAVRLLLERGRAVDPDVLLDEPVLEIVRRLDGLPLAIELAAARLRVLSTAEVAQRLADRFRLLTGGRRTATPRHRTLRAVVEWSWDLLSPPEREVAEHFALFSSGAAEQAVAAVCPSWRDGGEPDELADVLHALVDKSLLVADRTPAGTRFRMLETLREYGAERLAEQGLISAARAAHARFFAGLAAAADPRLRGPGQLEALRLFDTEREELLTALRFLGDDGDAAGALDLVVHLSWYWLIRESGQEATRWLQFALDVPGADDVREVVLARALFRLIAVGTGTVTAADPRAGLSELAESLAGSGIEHAAATFLPPLMLFLAEERTGAEAALDRAITDPDPWVRAAGRLMRMAYAENDGDMDTLRRHAESGVPEWEELGDIWGLATMLTSRAQVRTLDGDLLGASEDLERAQACIRLLGSHDDQVMVTMRMAELRLRAGDIAGARRNVESLREHRSYNGGRPERAILIAAAEAGVSLVEDDDTTLARAYAELREALDSLGEPSIFSAHGGAAGHAIATMLALRLGADEAADEHVHEAYQQGVLTNDRPILASVGLAVAGWALRRGRPAEAAAVLGATDRLRGTADATNPVVVTLTDALRRELGAEFDARYAEGLALDAPAATARLDPAALAPSSSGRQPLPGALRG
jgi:predicted ATPase/DNA-binding SARP family transcriptional activator